MNGIPYDYFTDRTRVYGILPGVAQHILNKQYVYIDFEGKPIVVFNNEHTSLNLTYLLSLNDRITLRTIYHLFFQHFLSPSGGVERFDTDVRDRLYDPDRKAWRTLRSRTDDWNGWISRRVRELLDEYEGVHGIPAERYLKGMCGIPPYVTDIPIHVHRMVTVALVPQRLGLVDPEDTLREVRIGDFIYVS